MIDKWELGARVRIVNNEGDSWWNGRTGTVAKVCIARGAAWLHMDQPLPANKRMYPAYGEWANCAKVYSSECELIAGKSR